MSRSLRQDNLAPLIFEYQPSSAEIVPELAPPRPADERLPCWWPVMVAIAATAIIDLLQPAVLSWRTFADSNWKPRLLESVIAAQAALILAVGAWAPGGPLRRVLVYGGMLLSVGVLWQFGELLASGGPIWVSDAVIGHCLLWPPKILVAAAPLILLRHFCGWCLAPAAQEPPLGVRDLLLATTLIAVALGAANAGFHLLEPTGFRRQETWTDFTRRGLFTAGTMLLFVPPTAWLALNFRRRTALHAVLLLSLIAAAARGLSSAALFKPMFLQQPPRILLDEWPPVVVFLFALFAGFSFLGRYGYRVRLGRRMPA